MTLQDKTGATVTVELETGDRPAYAIVMEDGTRAGRTFFRDRENERVFYHTEVDESFGGRGLATILVREAVNATRETGRTIVPVCPLVKSFLEKNASEYDGAFRRTTPADFAWVKENVGGASQ